MPYLSYDTPAEFFGPGYEVATNEIQISTSSKADVSVGNFTVATNLMTLTAHGLRVGYIVTVSNSGGSLPGGLSPSTRYYVKSTPDANTLTLSATNGGPEIVCSSVGTGTHTMVLPPLLTHLSDSQAAASSAQMVFAVVDMVNTRFNAIPAADRPTKFSISRTGYTDEASGELVYNYAVTCRVTPVSFIAPNS